MKRHFSVQSRLVLITVMFGVMSFAACATLDQPDLSGRTAMSSVGSLTLCIQHLRSPDCRERDEAARVIWERFSSRLQSLVRRHLDNRIRRREDEQDILQSMYSSFCLGQFA